MAKKKILNSVGTASKKAVEGLTKVEFSETNFKLKKSKKKYIVLFTIQDGNSRTIESIKRVKASATSIRVGKEKEFPFDISKNIYTHRNKAYYILDLNKGQLHLDLDDTYKFNPKLLKKLVRDEIITQTISRMSGQQAKTSIYLAIFSAIFGGLLGCIITLIGLGVI